MPTSSITAEDLICIQCGYDLRTLPADSNCPECGRTITDSVRMGPLMRWLPGFRRGVTFLCLAFIVGMPHIQRRIYDQAWDRFHLNAEGASAVFFAFMFLPAAWFLTTPNVLRPKMRRARKSVLLLLIAQFVFGVCELRFFRHPWPFDRARGNHILMAAYALEPLVFVTLLWLLLEILYRSLPLLGNPIPRWLYRVAQWPLIYSRMGLAIFFGIVCVGRIIYEDVEPPGFRYLMPERLSRFLELILVRPAYLIMIPVWFTFLLILLYLRYRIHRRA